MVDFLSQAKNVLSGKSPNAEPVISADNRIDRVDQCKVVWYQWENELSTDSKNAFNIGSPIPISASSKDLAKARSYDISNHIESSTYTKGMDGAAGSFQIVLHNSFDWPRFMRPGQWLLIFLTPDGDLPMPEETNGGVNTKGLPGIGASILSTLAAGGSLLNSFIPGTASLNAVPELPLPKGPPPSYFPSIKKRMRCMGIIQRVGIRSVTNMDRTVETSFVITGKDFGTIYEESELWFNANNADGATFTAAINAFTQQFTRNLSDLLDKWHDVFINPNSVLDKNLTSVKSFFPEQWVLPDRLVQDLALPMKQDGKGYFGDISNLKEFNATVFENPDPNPLAGLQGRCWDRLKNLSQPEFHELFTELGDSGNPKLYFRPIPWALDKSRYPVTGKLMLNYKDLASPDELPPPVPVGTNAATFTKLLDLDNLSKITGPQDDTRTIHSVYITAAEVDSYDIGADYHNRANFFLVDSMKSMFDQTNAFALQSKSLTPFPLRDESDIKRHGFKPRFVSLNSFNTTNEQLFGNSASAAFMLETNELIKDFYANAEDFYSGTMSLAAAKNSVKLGKVIVTDDSFQGIGEMVFYIEGYSDSFTVNGEGTGSWTQSLMLTRGMQKTVLEGGSSKDKQGTQSETFHVFNKDVKNSDSSTLGKIKNAIKNPTSLF